MDFRNPLRNRQPKPPNFGLSSSSSNINLELGIAFDWEKLELLQYCRHEFLYYQQNRRDLPKTVEDAGYKPLLYSSKNYLDLIWQPSQLAQKSLP